MQYVILKCYVKLQYGTRCYQKSHFIISVCFILLQIRVALLKTLCYEISNLFDRIVQWRTSCFVLHVNLYRLCHSLQKKRYSINS